MPNVSPEPPGLTEKSPELKPVTGSPSHPEASQVQQRAEASFQAGETLIKDGKFDEAKQCFNKAIDILFQANTKDGKYKDLLNQYITKITNLESDYHDEMDISENDDSDSFLEEVISTPLTEPSLNDVQRIQEAMDKQKTEVQYSLPVSIDSTVVAFIKAFQNAKFKNIQHALNRCVEYIDSYKQIFRDHNVPEDLAYLPLIESGFRVEATSRSRACGIWQFMAATARLYGLKVDSDVDERRDPFKSVIAAAKYLKRLYEDFGDWYVAMACYNGGTKRVKNALNRHRTNNFFDISKSRYIKKETRNYVPAFLASLIIAKNPETYGFKIEKNGNVFENTKTVSVISPCSLKQAAELANVPVDKLKEMNPELVEDTTPFSKEQYDLRVPKDVDETVFSQLTRVPKMKRHLARGKRYIIRRGDNLSSISRKFRIPLQRLRSANHLKSNRLKPGKSLIIPR
ncbi:MAG: transglycosylase SLT domain-containing protein [Candidatus Omnitrophota bacterium]